MATVRTPIAQRMPAALCFGRRPARAALAALTAIAVGGGAAASASAATAARSRPLARGSAVPGGTTGRAPSRGALPRGPEMTILAAPHVPGHATGDLSTVESQTLHGGYVAAGIGMRDLGHGTITVSGIPGGATVTSAILMWDVLGVQQVSSFAQGKVDGHAITGTAWASGAEPCWSGAGVNENFSYEADVTKLVPGNGSYKLSGFASGLTNGANPWSVAATPPLLEGASLVVIYRLGSMPLAVIQIAEGAAESQQDNQLTAKLDGFTVSSRPSAKTTFVVADGQQPGNTAAFGGKVLRGVGFPGNDPQAVPHYSEGNLWDTVTVDVGSDVKAGQKSVTAGVTGGADPATGYYDCIVWVGQVLDVSTPNVGIYTDFKFRGQVTTALKDHWPLVANVAGLGRKAARRGQKLGSPICSGSHTRSYGTDANVERELSAYERAHPSANVPWLSYWTVAAPKPTQDPRTVGRAAGEFAAKEIEKAWAAEHAHPVLPAYVVLDPEGPPCGGRSWYPAKKDKLMSATAWRQFAVGWAAGVSSQANLSPAIYVNPGEYRRDKVATLGLPVFLAVTDRHGSGHIPAEPPYRSAAIAGYVAFYANCRNAGPDIRKVDSWGAQFSTVQFSGARSICKP